MGICGWGWITGNFPTLDKALPKDVAFSAISMSVGRSFVSPNFDRLDGREKWAIPVVRRRWRHDITPALRGPNAA